MNPKVMSFWTMSWFISVLICLVMQGTYWGTGQVDTMWNLSLFTKFDTLWFSIPVMNTAFLDTIWKIVSWDYSFYTGPYELLRYAWMVILTPGAVWGFYTALQFLIGQVISLFKFW